MIHFSIADVVPLPKAILAPSNSVWEYLMSRNTTFRRRLTWNLVTLSTGCLLLLSVAVLGTAVQIVRAHFEEMAVDSTMLSVRYLGQMQGGAGYREDTGESGEAVDKERLIHTFGLHARALMGDQAILFDRDGALVSNLASTVQGRDGDVVGLLAPHARSLLAKPEVGHVAVRDHSGMWVGTPIATADGSPIFAVFLHHSMDGAKRLVFMTALYVLGLTIVLSVLAVVLGTRLSQRLSQPLRTLYHAVNRLGDGELDHRIEAKLQDEFGQIAEAFNDMASSMQRYMEKIASEAQHREQLESEFRIAAQLQHSLLPNQLPEIEGLKLSAMSRPAREVGGDFYDVVLVGGDSIYFAIGDATNKGLPAAIHVTQCASSVRTLAREGYSPAQVLRQVNTLLYENLGDSCRFVTLFLAKLDLNTRALTFSSAGHNPPVLIRASTTEPQYLKDKNGLPLGLSADGSFDDQIIQLHADDMLLLYTDGLSEAMNESGEMLGMERIIQTLRHVVESETESTLGSVLKQVDEYEGGVQHDDLTMLVIRLE